VHALLAKIEMRLPIIQAPMAGVSTPAMAAAVSNAGGLGSLGLGSSEPEAARGMIAAFRKLSSGPLNANLFCHTPARPDEARDKRWIDALRPAFAAHGSQPPAALREIYRSFVEDDGMLAMLLQERPRVVSFHFGLPSRERVAALKDAGIVLLATATTLEEARIIDAAGIDGIVAQGYEAGGHRGIFNPDIDDAIGTLALVRIITAEGGVRTPVVAAGGIMDGAGIAAAMKLGAVAAQLGTAFIDCPESSADAGYRAALRGPSAHHTIITRAVSGRPARCLANRFTQLGESLSGAEVPAYPLAYDAGKALNAAAKGKGEFGYGAQWAGQGAPLCRSLPASELVRVLASEAAQAGCEMAV